MERLLHFFGISLHQATISVPDMEKRLHAAAKNDQIACDVLNESRRKRGQPMLRCGEGLPSWEGQLEVHNPAWEYL